MPTALTLLLPLVIAPLLPGVVNRTKAFFAGRTGPPLRQLYADLYKLLRKGVVYSHTTTWVFRIGPVVGLAALITACVLLPFGGLAAPLAFSGDLVLFAYLLGLARFFTVLAALDTGSSFEGMGAAREVFFSALAELPLFFGLAALAGQARSLSLSGIFFSASHDLWTSPALILVAVAFLMVFLTENARMPVDDPNTHLELTMIHEVMILDHSGPDLALILYGAALKLWLLGTLLVGILIPVSHPIWVTPLASLAAMLGLAVLLGIIESVMARLRLVRVPHLLMGAGAIALVALVLVAS